MFRSIHTDTKTNSNNKNKVKTKTTNSIHMQNMWAHKKKTIPENRKNTKNTKRNIAKEKGKVRPEMERPKPI